METKSKLLNNKRNSSDSDTEKGVKVEDSENHLESEDEMIVLDGNEAAAFLSQDNCSRRISSSRKDSSSSFTLKIIPNLILADSEKSEKEKMIQSHENGQEMENRNNYYNGNNKGSQKDLSENGNQNQSQVEKRTNNKSDNKDESAGDEKKIKVERTGWKRYLGISLAIFSSVIFSLGILIVKTLKAYHPFTIALWRFQGVLLPSIPLILHAVLIQKKKIFRTVHPVCQPEKSKMFFFLFLRAFSGCSAVVLHYYSLKYMNMADSTVIAFSTPVFVTFLAHFFLGESCGIMNVLSALVTLIGVTVICRPKFLTGQEEMDTDLLIGASLALGSMCFASCVFLSLRVLKGINYAVVTLFFGAYATVECIILSVIVSNSILTLPETSWDWFLVLTLCVITFVGQVCTTLAVKFEEAGVVALCRTFDVVFSFIWQFLFLGVIPTVFSFVGSLIVMSGVILIVFRKYLNMLPPDHPMRQRFCIILK